MGDKIRTSSVFRFVLPVARGLFGKLLDRFSDKPATQELERSLSLLEATLESTEDGILVVDSDGRISRFNQKFVKLWGIPEDILDQKDDAKTIQFVLAQLEHPGRFLAKINELYSNPELQSLDVIEFKDGRVFERYSQAQRIDSRVVGRVWSFRDVTEKQRVQEELQKSREKLEEKVLERTRELSQTNTFLTSLIENNPNVIFVKSAHDLRYVQFNRAGETMFGYSREELIGKTDFEFFSREQAEKFTADDRATLASGVVLDISEESVHTQTLGMRILHTRKIPLYDPRGRPQYLLGISEDITEQKRADQDRMRLIQEREARLEAEKSIQLRDDFLSIASHELRTPLTPIRMFLQLIKRHLESERNDDAKANLLLKGAENADQQFDRFLKLVENLLDVSRITAGRLVLEREHFNLSELIHELVNRFDTEFNEAKCRSELKIKPGVEGYWDRMRLEQAIINLFTNAIKYGAGRPIEVILTTELISETQNTVKLVVRDQGIGIDPKDHTKIFSRFERVSSLKYFSGLGLGLFITRNIVEAHGGTITVESAPGAGASFAIILPLA